MTRLPEKVRTTFSGCGCSGERIVRCHASMDDVIGVRIVECHASIHVVIGIRVVLCHPLVHNLGFSTSCPNSHLVVML